MATKIKAGFSYNHILVYDFLASDEKMQTGRWLQDDLLHYADGETNAGLTRHHIKSAEEWDTHVSILRREISTTNLRPVIHIEAHGDLDRGLEIGDSKEMISWQHLHSSLVAINTLLRNNLVVVVSACYGSYLLTAINPTTPCPYFMLIGPDDEIQKGTLISELPAFYKELFAHCDMKKAMEKLSPIFVKTFTIEFFFAALRKYFFEDCVGRAKQERLERLTTRAVEEGHIYNRQQLRFFRKLARKYYGLNEEVLLRYGNTFFHGTIRIPAKEFLNSIRIAASTK